MTASSMQFSSCSGRVRAVAHNMVLALVHKLIDSPIILKVRSLMAAMPLCCDQSLMALLLCSMLASASAGSNGEAMRPPMTWRSWNQFAQFINTSIIQKMVRSFACVW